MTTLAADKILPIEEGDYNDLPVIASDIIYRGAAVGIVSGTGYARPLAAGDKFVGFAEATADNSAGAAGAINVRVLHRGKVQVTVSGIAITDIGASLYASDDDTFTKTSSGNSLVGKVHRYVGANTCVVAFNGPLLS